MNYQSAKTNFKHNNTTYNIYNNNNFLKDKYIFKFDEKYAFDKIYLIVKEKQLLKYLFDNNEKNINYDNDNIDNILKDIDDEILGNIICNYKHYADYIKNLTNINIKIERIYIILNYLKKSYKLYAPWMFIKSIDKDKLFTDNENISNDTMFKIINNLCYINNNYNNLKKDKTFVLDFSNFLNNLNNNLIHNEKLNNNLSLQDILISYDKNKRNIVHLACKVDISYKIFETIINIINTLSKISNSENKINLKSIIDFRDIYLRTPLHISCSKGFLNNFILLLNNGASVYNLDAVGRSIIHYACTANSIHLVEYLLENYFDLFSIKDYYMRTPIHYLIFNTNENINKSILFLIKIFMLQNEKSESESVIDINSYDDQGKTVLHYISELGIKWAIVDVIEMGGNPLLQDKITNKNSIQLSKNHIIKEMIIIAYSNYIKQLNNKNSKKDMIFQKNKSNDKKSLLLENKLTLEEAKEIINKENINKKREEEEKLKEYYNEIIYGIERIKLNKYNNINQYKYKFDKELYNAFVTERKEKFDVMLSLLQTSSFINELKSPEIITGSWINKINSPKDLIEELSKYSPAKAVLMIYNILNPLSFKKIEHTNNIISNIINK